MLLGDSVYMKKVSNILYKIILMLSFGFFLIISYKVVVFSKSVIRHDSREELWLYILIALIICLLFMQIIKILQKKQIYQYAYSWLVCGGLIILLQFAYAFSLKMVPIWDSRNIINESARMLTDQVPQISSVNGYFDMYGNNYPIVIFLYNYYRILDFFHINNFWTASIVLNIILIDISIVIFCVIIKKVKNSKWSFDFFMLCFFNPYTYLYTTFVYPTTFSLAAIAIIFLIIYCLFKSFHSLSNKRYIFNSILLGTAAILFFKLRATNFIVIIAFLIVGYIYWRNKANKDYFYISKKVIIFFLLCMSLGGIGTGALYNKIEENYVSEEMKSHNFPITHWIMMSNSNGSKGMFSEEDEKKTASCETYEEKIDMNLKELKSRLQAFSGKELLVHIIDKISVNWCEGGEYIQELMQCNQTYGGTYRFLAGEDNAVFSAYYQLYLGLIYFWGGSSIIKNILSKKIDYLYFLCILSLMGAFLFYVIWEVSPCYNICFVPLFGILATYSINMPRKCSCKNYQYIIYPVIIGASMIIFNNEATLNEKTSYDNFSISSIYRRPLLEHKTIDINQSGKELTQRFYIRETKKFNCISFLVNTLGKNKDDEEARYLFTLYADNEKMLYQTEIKYDENYNGEFYYTIKMPMILKSGYYRFLIKPLGTEDSYEFIYTRQEIVDNNPKGFLTINNNNGQEKNDLIFNVYYER